MPWVDFTAKLLSHECAHYEHEYHLTNWFVINLCMRVLTFTVACVHPPRVFREL